MAGTPLATCAYCGRPIWPGQPNVYLALAPAKDGKGRSKSGFMHSPCHAEWFDQTHQIIRDAIRGGTHSKTTRRVCGHCREWVESFAHKTLDGILICKACAVRGGYVAADGSDIDAAAELAKAAEAAKRLGDKGKGGRL